MEGLKKQFGISYDEITSWLIKNKIKFKSVPLTNEDGALRPLEKRLLIGRSHFSQVTSRFGTRHHTSIGEGMYFAHYALPNPPDFLKNLDGEVRLMQGKIMERTYISYVDNVGDNH